MSEARFNRPRRPDAVNNVSNEHAGGFGLIDRAKGLARLLAIVGGIGAVAAEMAPAPAMAKEPTEQRDPEQRNANAIEALRTYESLQRAYQQFDIADLQQATRVLELYKKNMDIAAQLPPEQRSEFERQYAWLNHRSIVLQYGATTEYIPSELVAKRDAHKKADEVVLVLSLNLLDQAAATRRQVDIDDWAAAEANSTFKRKVEALSRSIQVTLECIMGNLPEAVAAKQEVIDQLDPILKQAGYSDVKIEVKTPVADGSVHIEITVRLGDSTIITNAYIIYRYQEKTAAYNGDSMGIVRAKTIHEAIQAGLH